MCYQMNENIHHPFATIVFRHKPSAFVCHPGADRESPFQYTFLHDKKCRIAKVLELKIPKRAKTAFGKA